jgi:hypothetical protein
MLEHFMTYSNPDLPVTGGTGRPIIHKPYETLSLIDLRAKPLPFIDSTNWQTQWMKEASSLTRRDTKVRTGRSHILFKRISDRVEWQYSSWAQHKQRV